MVWLRDPTAELLALAARADVMSATDCLSVTGDEHKWPERAQGVNRCAYNPGNSAGHAAFNTGVVYFRATNGSLSMVQEWRQAMLRQKGRKDLNENVNDQSLFNQVHPDRRDRHVAATRPPRDRHATATRPPRHATAAPRDRRTTARASGGPWLRAAHRGAI